jgi:pyruvate,water dikinase
MTTFEAALSVSAPWLERLRERVQGRAWVKGATNFDEDLHFSTYYLRASIAGGSAPLYRGYSSVVALYDGFDETYYLLEDECRATASALLERALREPRWLPRILARIRTRSDALSTIFRPDTSPESLARLPAERLLALYRRHDALTRALYLPARLPEALDRGVGLFTSYLLEHLRARGLSASEGAEAFAALSEPTAPSVLAQEIAEFDEIVLFARSRAPEIRPSGGASGRARMALDPELLRRLDEHRARWQFLAYHGYGRRELPSLESYVARLFDELRAPPPAQARRSAADRREGAERERRVWLARLDLDPAHAALFAVYPEIGAAKLYRRSAQLRNFYFLDMLLAEIARRLEVSEWTVRCLLPEEVIAALAAGRLEREEARERAGGCAYVVLDGEEHVAAGAEAEEVRRLFRRGPAREEGGPLRGVVASRGRAAGRCRIVIRAADCRADFAPGTILVSESTDPDLVPLLREAGAVLTEQGGVTSHAAIICRELGVPTVIGIDGLLERVRDGDWLEVDAERGEVVRRDAERPAAGGAAADTGARGAKAANLGRARSLGFRVPEFVVLDYDEVHRAAREPEEGALRGLAERAREDLGTAPCARLAVRSSAALEDGAGASLAGTYASLLDVAGDDLAAALRDFVARNAARGGAAYRGGVIVQRMVEADCAGVCLTRDERTGRRDAVIIEMTPRRNTGVTGGTVRPDRVVVDRLTGDILEEAAAAGAARSRAIDLAAMVRQFLTLESHFGRPLDIEWALVGRELYILQARPIAVAPRARRRRARGA